MRSKYCMHYTVGSQSHSERTMKQNLKKIDEKELSWWKSIFSSFILIVFAYFDESLFDVASVDASITF